MTANTSRRDWELPLQRFEKQIITLRQKIAGAKESQRREAAAKLDDLAQRHRELLARLDELKHTRQRYHAETEADIEKVANDLSAGLTQFIDWVDRDYEGKPPSP